MGRHASRREFLGRSAALAVAVGAGIGAAPAAIPIIDSHQHLWDLSKFRLPWLAAGQPLAHDFLMDAYLKDAEGLGVVKTVYVEVDVAPDQHRAEADYVVDLCRRKDGPLAGAVIGGRPASDGFADDLAYYKDKPEIKGMRQVLHGGTPPGTCLDPKFIRGIRLLGESGLSFDLCLRPAELPDATRLVDACPGTSFILDHCGNPKLKDKDLSAWRDDIARMAERENVACKVSGLTATFTPGSWTAEDIAPAVDRVLSAFGPDRVLFGGDWPVCNLASTLRGWTDALREVVRSRPEAEQRKLFHDNALRVYRLA
ncbi:amidohydrolase family protein [Tundrisphaera sp. TA3]|uniref:amidohydrolase family protein n=1 Tax=Tundrisphaera sp. TA3 TaxID=3435775 RepID=UPI003EB8E748